MTDYYIDKKIEPFLHSALYDVVRDYIIDSYNHRVRDVYRGYLKCSFHLGLISVNSFVFLVDFMAWLENKDSFSDIDSDMYKGFYEGFVKDLDSNYK